MTKRHTRPVLKKGDHVRFLPAKVMVARDFRDHCRFGWSDDMSRELSGKTARVERVAKDGEVYLSGLRAANRYTISLDMLQKTRPSKKERLAIDNEIARAEAEKAKREEREKAKREEREKEEAERRAKIRAARDAILSGHPTLKLIVERLRKGDSPFGCQQRNVLEVCCILTGVDYALFKDIDL